MDDDQLRRLIAARAAIQLQDVIDAVSQVGREVEEAHGVRFVHHRPAIEDAVWADVLGMAWQASAFVKAVELLRPFMEPSPGRSIGAALKTADPDDTADVRRLLREAGLLGDEP